MIKIEVTGNSIPEVADKLLAIGASLRASSTTINAVDDAAREALQAKRNVANEDKAARVMVTKKEVAEAAPVDPTPAPLAATSAGAAASSAAADTHTAAPAASVSEDEELEVVDLPIAAPEVNLRDLVLSVVEKRGKPVMEEILTRFGVAKASMVSPELLPELIDLCNEALAK